MPARTRAFVFGAALSALLLPAALVATTQGSAQAAGARPHDLRMYKIEKYVALEGEFPDNQSGDLTLACSSGDYAVDGMWRIDAVDNSVAPDRDVVFSASHADAVDRHIWHFSFENRADGRAHVKLWVTCLAGRTEKAFGHRHDLTLQSASSSMATHAVGDWHYVHPTACSAGSVPVAPGFEFTSGSGLLQGSWPGQSAGQGWQWRFQVDTPADVTFTLSCLGLAVTPAGARPHTHAIHAGWNPDLNGSVRHVPVSSRTEEQLSCEGGEKAMVGAFWIDDPDHTAYLGMDPRLKTRAFTFRRDSGGSDVAWVGGLCVDSRTGKQLKP